MFIKKYNGKLIIQYKQLRAYADYVVIQNNTLTEKDELLVEEEQITKLSMNIIGISLGGTVSVKVAFGDVVYNKGRNPIPLFLKEYTNVLSDIFKEVELRIDSRGQILSIENQKEIEKNGIRKKIMYSQMT